VKRNYVWSVPCGWVLALALLPIGARAQLEEIVVTAQKREQGVNDVGITVNVFSEEQLQDFGIRSSSDLEKLVPGLTVTNAQPSGVPTFTIRGVGFQTFNAGASSTVGLYIDETNIPYSVLIGGALFDIERIEVLKGPQGDLYGRNSTAGQINFVSRKPTDELTAGATVSYGRFDVLDVEGYVSGQISDTAKGRLAVKYLRSDEGWQRSITRPDDELGALDEIALRGLLELDPTDSVNVLLNLHYNRNRSENIAGTALADNVGGALGPLPLSTGDSRAADWTPTHRPENDNDAIGASARISWNIDDGLALTSITAYDDFQRNDKYDTSGIPQSDADSTNDTSIKVFSQELRLEKTDLPGWYLLGGLFYSKDEVDEDYLLINGGGILGLALGLNGLSTRWSQDTDSISAFGHVEKELGERWKLTLGARYTHENRDWTGCTYDSGDGTLAGLWNNILTPFLLIPAGAPDPGLIGPGACGVYDDIPTSPTFGQFSVFSDEIETNKGMGKISLDYSPTEDVLLFATLATGFKSGGFNGAAVQTHQGLLPYRPEELTSLELGVKTTLFDRRLQLNAAAFGYRYEDKQEGTIAVTPVGNIVVAITNVPKSEIYGVELESRWQLLDGLIWDLGVAYLDTEITEYQQIDPVASVWPDVVTFDASGNSLDNSPEWQATTGLTFTHPISDTLDFSVSGVLTYKDDSITVNQTIEGYTLINARIGVGSSDGKWSAFLWGRNLGDEYYYTSESISNSTTIRLNGQPITYGISLSYAL
jgi:iron complex outermembrane receptor protein